MPITTTHPDYAHNVSRAIKNRVAIEGQDSVRNNFSTYFAEPEGLTKLRLKQPTEYNAILENYKNAAIWKPYPAKMIDSINGMLFKENVNVSSDPESLEHLKSNFDGKGSDITSWAQETVKEMVSSNRMFSFVIYSDIDKKPYIRSFPFESVINWRSSFINGKEITEFVILKVEEYDDITADKWNTRKQTYYIELSLKNSNGNPYDIIENENYNGTIADQEHIVDMGTYHYAKYKSYSTASQDAGTLVEEYEVLAGGKAIDFIPFYIFSKNGTGWECGEPLINGVVDLSFGIYNNSAQYEVGMAQSATPTPVMLGFTPEEVNVASLGAHGGIATSNHEAKVAYLENTGAGLGELRKAMDDKKADIADIGVYVLSDGRGGAETAEALKIRKTGENGILSDLAYTIEHGIKRLYEYASLFVSNPKLDNDVSEVNVTVNKDFDVGALTSKDIFTYYDMVTTGGMSLKDYYKILRRDGITTLSFEEWNSETIGSREEYSSSVYDPDNEQTINAPARDQDKKLVNTLS